MKQDENKRFQFPLTAVVSSLTVALVVGAGGFYAHSIRSDASVSTNMDSCQRRLGALEHQLGETRDALADSTVLTAETVALLREHIKRGDEYIKRYDSAVDIVVQNRERVAKLEQLIEGRYRSFPVSDPGQGGSQ